LFNPFFNALEDMSLFILSQKIYEDIRLGIAQRREEQERFIREIKEILKVERI